MIICPNESLKAKNFDALTETLLELPREVGAFAAGLEWAFCGWAFALEYRCRELAVIVVLPDGFHSFSREERMALLFHEVAHAWLWESGLGGHEDEADALAESWIGLANEKR